jgi:plastocyanin
MNGLSGFCDWRQSGAMKFAVMMMCALVPALQAGVTIEGVVTLPKKSAAAAASARYKTPLQVGAADAPAAIVYLEGKFPAAATNTVEVGQRHYQFTPGLMAVQKGTKVRFPNYDDDYHNVFTLSKVKRFDLGRYRKDEEPASQTFDQVGVVKLFCEIHEHMRGTVLVLDTPYFAKTAAGGKYALTNLPAGAYALKAWIDEKVVWEKAVELKDGETLKVDFGPK